MEKNSFHSKKIDLLRRRKPEDVVGHFYDLIQFVSAAVMAGIFRPEPRPGRRHRNCATRFFPEPFRPIFGVPCSRWSSVFGYKEVLDESLIFLI